jgi:hypothetical protein
MYYQITCEVTDKGKSIFSDTIEVYPPICPCCNIYCKLDKQSTAIEIYKEANPLFENPIIVSLYESSAFTTIFTISDTHEYVNREHDEIVEDKVIQVVSMTVYERLTLD